VSIISHMEMHLQPKLGYLIHDPENTTIMMSLHSAMNAVMLR
jgi:hypothetical protein